MRSKEGGSSRLIERACEASARFDQQARRPVVVEFAGVPKAGKTSTVGQVAAFFKRCGFRVEVVVERASVCPIRDKKHANFNIWTACTTLAQLLERTQDPPRPDDPQILILDRGIFDSLCWLSMMERLARIRGPDRGKVETFLLIDDWRKRISGVVVMSASPNDSMDRERGHLPVPGAAGSIMNTEVLEQMRKTTAETAEKHKKAFRVLAVDTSSKALKNNPQKTCELIADQMLNWIEEHLEEAILHVSKTSILRHFGDKAALNRDQAEAVCGLFRSEGVFRCREQVEHDESVVQALPVAVVRNQTGDVLRLKRRERTDDNPLHEKLVVWAGGHVRQEDSYNGDPLLHAAHRELHEELRLDVEEKRLTLLGAIHIHSNAKTGRHVALVFEWRADTDDVAVSLSSAEFFERRGTSLSGKFVKVDDLVHEVETGKMTEPWSVEIVRELLPDTATKASPRLF
ncbi:MAG: NUDIX domain-containing protein [Planctomycetes bacterium]|nr:NUDIX domain-containing protein [Planctomycetota bacterium]